MKKFKKPENKPRSLKAIGNDDNLSDYLLSHVVVGTVISVADVTRKGVIKVEVDIFGGTQAIEAKAATPFAGAGYGFFSVPSPGSRVLLVKPDSDGDWVWFGCLVGDHYRVPDRKTEPIANLNEKFPRIESPEDPTDLDGEEKVKPDTPDSELVYQDNFLPEAYVWKSPDGHKFVMSDKATQERISRFVKMRSSAGKQVILDDSPAAQGGDNIRIIDESGNRIVIQTSGKEGGWIKEFAKHTIEKVCKEGDITHTILPDGKGDILMENMGSGDIKAVSHKGDVNLAAKKELKSKSKTTVIESSESATIQVGKHKIVVDEFGITITTETGEELYVGPGGARISNPGQPITFIGSFFSFIQT